MKFTMMKRRDCVICGKKNVLHEVDERNHYYKSLCCNEFTVDSEGQFVDEEDNNRPTGGN